MSAFNYYPIVRFATSGATTTYNSFFNFLQTENSIAELTDKPVTIGTTQYGKYTVYPINLPSATAGSNPPQNPATVLKGYTCVVKIDDYQSMPMNTWTDYAMIASTSLQIPTIATFGQHFGNFSDWGFQLEVTASQFRIQKTSNITGAQTAEFFWITLGF